MSMVPYKEDPEAVDLAEDITERVIERSGLKSTLRNLQAEIALVRKASPQVDRQQHRGGRKWSDVAAGILDPITKRLSKLSFERSKFSHGSCSPVIQQALGMRERSPSRGKAVEAEPSHQAGAARRVRPPLMAVPSGVSLSPASAALALDKQDSASMEPYHSLPHLPGRTHSASQATGVEVTVARSSDGGNIEGAKGSCSYSVL
jgi:hypothetical protein